MVRPSFPCHPPPPLIFLLALLLPSTTQVHDVAASRTVCEFKALHGFHDWRAISENMKCASCGARMLYAVHDD